MDNKMEQDDKINEILISLASKNNVISYDELFSALNIEPENTRELENVLIQAIYQDVIQGRLNPKLRQVEISDWRSEVGVPDLNFMANTLHDWIKHCNQFVHILGGEIESSNNQLADDIAQEKALEEEVQKVKKNLIASGKLGKECTSSSCSDLQLPPSKPGGKSESKRSSERLKSSLRLKRGMGGGGGN